MSKSLKITLFVILGLTIGIGSIYFFVLNSFDTSMDSVINNQVIEFDELNEKAYFSARAWGIAGNHEEIILSTSPISDEHRAYSKDECFIFYTSEVYYKKKGADTLLIYAGSSSIADPPMNQPTQIKIIPVELKNYDEVKDYKQNYKKYGLSKISVY